LNREAGARSTMNEAWHRRNPMPKNPTEEERLAWHKGHAEGCGCREVPRGVRSTIAKGPARDSQDLLEREAFDPPAARAFVTFQFLVVALV